MTKSFTTLAPGDSTGYWVRQLIETTLSIVKLPKGAKARVATVAVAGSLDNSDRKPTFYYFLPTHFELNLGKFTQTIYRFLRFLLITNGTAHFVHFHLL
jgi:hypothetical protein